MKIGFIGAGKVGFSLGKYFTENGISVSGYYSRNPRSSAEAAQFTQTKSYDTIADILQDSDTLFITTSDHAIATIWDQMKNLNVKNKNICHCSGSISSTVFFNGEKLGAHIYSIHPLYAVNDKYTSWKNLSDAHFTVEGSNSAIDDILEIFQKTGNKVTIISAENKPLYHCAAATASNLAIAVFKSAVDMLGECGFTKNDATQALLPLYAGNCKNMETAIKNGQPLETALTGPIERGDVETVKKHLVALAACHSSSDGTADETACHSSSDGAADETACRENPMVTLYKILSDQLVELGKAKDPQKDYSPIEEVLQR